MAKIRQEAAVFPGNDTLCAFLMKIWHHGVVSQQNEEKVPSLKPDSNGNRVFSLDVSLPHAAFHDYRHQTCLLGHTQTTPNIKPLL